MSVFYKRDFQDRVRLLDSPSFLSPFPEVFSKPALLIIFDFGRQGLGATRNSGNPALLASSWKSTEKLFVKT